MAKSTQAMYRRVEINHEGAGKNGPNWTTQRIMASETGRKLHLLKAEQLEDKAVSSFSLWNDVGWTFDNETAGAERTGINWRIKFEDGTLLTDAEYSDVLDWCKRFVWSLLVAPGNGTGPLSVSSLDSLGVGLKILLIWMLENNYRLPSELTPEAISDFCDDLPDRISDTGVITEAQVWLPIRTVSQLWKQRKAMTKAGCPAMLIHPFNGENSHSAARRISSQERGWIMPLPDEVVVPILNRAFWFLGAPANDILELIHQMYEAYFQEPGTHWNGEGISRHISAIRAKKVSNKFEFTDEGNDSWWLTRLVSGSISKEDIRTLFVDLAGACIAILQGATGMRISEIAAINAGMDDMSGLPVSVEIRKSASGLFELFYLKSHLAKGEESPRAVDWLMGMRLVGSTDIPPVVTALMVAQRLFDPVRWLAGTDRLLVSLPPGSGLPKSEAGVGPIYGKHLREWLRGFVERWVDLREIPDQSKRPTKTNDLVEYKLTKGRCIKPTQFRKTFASFSIQVSSSLIPALAMHFRHMSHAMTEQGYIGSNPVLLADRDSIAAQKTASIFFDLAGGNSRVAGRRGAHLLEHLEEAREKVIGSDVPSTWRNAEKLAGQLGTIAWFQIDGACLPLDSNNMLCHKEAGTQPFAQKLQPNHEFRRPSTCAGCANYLITSDNREFWVNRYRQNSLAVKQFAKLGSIGSLAVFEKRSSVAGTWLRMLGEDLERLDGDVNSSLKKPKPRK